MKKKIFISQPMRGLTTEEIKKTREDIINKIRIVLLCDVEILESYFEDYNPDTGCIPLKYLAKSIELLADADIAYFAKGWEDARGCRIEHECAEAYDITVICESEEL